MNAIRRFFSEAFLSQKGRSAAFAAEEFVLFEIAYPLVTMIFYCLLASFSFGTVRSRPEGRERSSTVPMSMAKSRLSPSAVM